MIVSAQDILAAIAWHEQSLEEFAAQYRRLTGLGMDRKQMVRHLGVTPTAVRNRVYRARKAGLIDKPQRAKRPVKQPRELLPCGTNAAKMRHQRRGEQACDACQEARRAYLTSWRKSRQVTS